MNKVVIGLGFGDEGKGIFTDYLCSHSPNSLVIRFSGGHQAGHTVVTDTTRHVFSNFGSGTLRGIPTYWSKYCTVEPIGLVKELKILQEKGVKPTLFIDEKCPITTPYEIFSNHEWEASNCHGSCGVGFGKTIEREENHFSLTFGDLFYPKVFKEKLRLIEKEYYNYDIEDKKHLDYFFEGCHQLVEYYLNCAYINKSYKIPLNFKEYIFEGSQGLLLDQHFGFFPNVTRSNTGCKNIVEILGSSEFIELFLVTRAYQTRHGNGFMTNIDIPHNILRDKNETNVENKYQGKFRRSLLDVSLLEYGINKDEYIRNSYYKNLVITCLDHIINEYRFTYKDKIICCNNENDFVAKIANILNIKNVYISKSNNSKNIYKI
jgi:adenylosuccinate synthase